MKVLVMFILAFWAANAQTAHYNRVLLDDPSAVCLDGSPGAYYLSVGQSPEKVIVYFEGGGWCGAPTLSGTLESCLSRSKTDLGSSKNYGPTLDVGNGFLSNRQENSFRNWTKVFIKYCTGAGHQGSRASPLSYKGTNLFFRGNNVTYAQLNSLESKIGLLTKATDIIVSGGSAGGLAAFLWADEVRRMASTDKVWAVPEAGLFLDEQNVKTQ